MHNDATSAARPGDTRGRTTAALAVLSFVAGSMDAIAFLALGSVFTSAMSGNTILLGLAIGQGHFNDALHAVVAIASYVAGVMIASARLGKHNYLHWELALESLCLAGFAALWHFTGGPARAGVDYGLIVLSALAMGIQGAASRRLGVPGVMTIIFTSTYTAIASSVIQQVTAGRHPFAGKHTARQLAALTAYLASAVFCGGVVAHWLFIAPFIPLAAIATLIIGLRLRLLHLDTESA
ncbi:MAG: DUF1275 domain-containing protein [Candidimonas sp.]|nr:MAG: DUF1275 domain-containing protein [Candidimonas sp.]